ncbi:ABC-type multidrug transport system ATPase subunit [Saccharomonospora amisosensis]|uniref:ABC-type multidrug transport system ATPase subunit n=1 Tax=Saccharomonospora amisosensis TaxID=1128677 RepID=A0A7X5ZR03_9PSEU|nr:hypothetical protein [Saccharomonospora amisosensis]NIJ12297.1 ABC-type multidrug transport system ATPase subunit [Saccharomonospora amisosensis]
MSGAFGAAGMAVRYTTRYLEEAERLRDRAGIIDHGRLIAEGTRSELVSKLGERDRVALTVDGDAAAFAASAAGCRVWKQSTPQPTRGARQCPLW